MKKKLLMRLAAAALAVGMCLSSAGAAYFTDVSPNSWYYGAAMECASYGLMKGYDDGRMQMLLVQNVRRFCLISIQSGVRKLYIMM